MKNTQVWRVCCKTWASMESLGAQITWVQKYGSRKIVTPSDVPGYVACAFDMSTYENPNPQAWTIQSFTTLSMLDVYKSNQARIIKNTGSEFVIEFDVAPFYDRKDHRRRFAKAIQNASKRTRDRYGRFS